MSNEQNKQTKPTDNTPIEEETWRDKEAEELETNQPTGERLPSLRLEPNKIVEIEIDFSQPFQKWTGANAKGATITKAIVPIVKLNGEDVRMNWWINTRNPIFRQIITAKGQTTFKIVQTGVQADTKYNLVN